MSDLRSKLIRLAHAKPELRKHLLPILKEAQKAHLEKVAVEVIELTQVQSQSVGAFRFVEKMSPRALSWNGISLEAIIKKAPSIPNWWLSALMYDPKTKQLWGYIDEVDADEDGAHHFNVLVPVTLNGKLEINKGVDPDKYRNLVEVAEVK